MPVALLTTCSIKQLVEVVPNFYSAIGEAAAPTPPGAVSTSVVHEL